MALDPRELFQSNTVGPTLRIFPEVVQVKTFAQGTAVLPVGAMVAVIEGGGGFWVMLDGDDSDTNGTEILTGIVYPDPIVLVAAAEVLGQVMVAGRMHADDALKHASDATPAGVITATIAEMTAQIQAAVTRQRGLYFHGIAGIE